MTWLSAPLLSVPGLCLVILGWVAAPSAAEVRWQQTAGPTGGVVSRMIIVDGKPWASLYSGGIFTFTGNRWQQIGIGRGITENRVPDLVVDPRDPRTVYTAQKIACGTKTIDGGAHWTGLCDALLPALDSPNYSSSSVAIDPNDHATIYLAGADHAGQSSIVMSPDRGESWTKVHSFDGHMPVGHLAFFRDRMYLGTEEGSVYRSDDRGMNWSEISNGLDGRGTGQFVADSTGRRLYLFTGLVRFNVRQGGSVYELDGAASRWKPLGGPDRVTSLAWGEGALWAGNEMGEIWKRDAKGWGLANRGAELPSQIFEIAVTKKNTMFAGVRGFGIFRSTDGGKRWKDATAGLIASATREVYVDPRNGNRLYTISWDRPGIEFSEDGGKSFTVLGKKEYVASIVPLPGSFSRLYAAGFNPGGAAAFYEVAVEGRTSTWTERQQPGPLGAVATVIAVDPADPAHVLMALSTHRAEGSDGAGVYASRDSGRTWQKLPLPPASSSYAILFNPKNPKILYVGLLRGGVYKSTDGGRTFRKLADERLHYTYRMAMSPSDPNVLLAGSSLFFGDLQQDDPKYPVSGGLFKSIDGGETWRDLIAGYRDYSAPKKTFARSLYNLGHMPNFEQLLIDPADHRRMLVGHHGDNVFLTTDDGATWVKQSAGMIPEDMHNYAYCLGADTSFTILYACTCGRGLFRGTPSEMIDAD